MTDRFVTYGAVPGQTLMSNIASSTTNGTTGLAGLQTGVCCCVNVTGPPESQVRLKRLGICEGRELTVLQSGDPMILGVVGTQVAVSRHLAEGIQVVPKPEAANDE